MSASPYRTCDLGHLTGHLRDLVLGGGAVVAVSGFPAAGKSTLARLLSERLGGVRVLVVDDEVDADVGPHEQSPELSAEVVAAHESLLARERGDGPLLLDGRHLAHPAVRHLADLHLWLDVDLNRANGNAMTREVERRRRVGDRRPVGYWSFEPPEPAPVPVEQQFFDAHRPDLAADLLFVPVGRMVPPVEIRFMNEVVDLALWDEGNEFLEELEDLLPMSKSLRDRIKDWARRMYMSPLNRPADPMAHHRAFLAEGMGLCRELQSELGPDWHVRPVGLGEPR